MTRLYKYPPTPVSVSVPPLSFQVDGVTTPVNVDSSNPENSNPLPTMMFIDKDGDKVAVHKDTATPANTVAVPVEIVSGSGTEINITAGDINVQMTDLGANFDALRVGDGSGNYIAVDAEGAISVKGPLTDAELRASAIQVTGPITDAELRASAIQVTGPLTDTELRATALEVTASALPLPTGAATSSKQDEILAKLPSSIGQKAAADSLSVVLASGTSLNVTSTTLSTSAKQDSQITELQEIELEVAAVKDRLPSSIGQKTPADSLSVVLATGATIDATVSGVATEAKQDDQIVLLEQLTTSVSELLDKTNPVDSSAIHTAQLSVGTSAVRATVDGSAPNASRKKLFIKPSSDNEGRVYLGASGVTTSNGLEIIGPDRLEFNLDASDYYLISDTPGQIVEILEKY